MAKRQRVYRRGPVYTVTGPGEKEGKFKLVGRAKIRKREVLLFQRVRKVRKRRLRRRRRSR